MKVDVRTRRRVVNELIKYGRKLNSVGDGSYTDLPAANRLVRKNWNAWLFAIIFDQGIPYKKAWEAPYLLKKRLGHFSMRRIARMRVGELRRAIKGPPALHRYVGKVPRWLKKAAVKLVTEYGGHAANIWKNCRTAAEVIERLDEFPGIGQKKAHMAARDLHENVVAFSRWSEINVAVDVHVMRVWKRANLTADLSVSGIMATAVETKPDYPGALDYPTWMIGQQWCHPQRPDCRGERRNDMEPCPLMQVCPRVGVGRHSEGN